METLKLLYIDDHPETSLSKYLDKYKSPSCEIEYSDIEFKPDEGYESFGVAAEIMARIEKDVFYDLDMPMSRLAAPDVPIPFSPALEKLIVPTEKTILNAIKELV